MATMSTAIQSTVEERLSEGVRDSLPRLDPFWKMFHDTYIGVSRDQIGKNWKAIHTFSESLHGAFKWVDVAGSAVDSTILTHSHIPSAVREYPGIEDTTMPGYFTMTITLAEGLGNLFVPQQYLRADQLDPAIGDTVGDLIRGCAQLTALQDIAAFYHTQTASTTLAETGVILGRVGDASPTNDATSITLGIKGAVNQFYNGQHVEIRSDTTPWATRHSTCQVVVDSVKYVPESTDEGYGEVTFKTKDGVTTFSGVVTDDMIIQQDSIGHGPHGPDHWLSIANTDCYGIDLTARKQFHSIVKASVGDLDETSLNQYFARAWKAYGTLNFPDAVLTSMGVTTALLDTSYGLANRFNRDLGERNVLKMGFDEPGPGAYMFNGIPIKWFVSPYMPSDSDMSGTQNGGRLWAMKTRDNNIRRYLAPPLPGSKRHAQFGSEVEFVLGGRGPEGIFKAYHSTTGRSTEWREAPFNRHVEYAPAYLPGINLSGITEIL